MANGAPGVGTPGSTPDQAMNQVEFLQGAGMYGSMGFPVPENTGLVYMGPAYAGTAYFGSTSTAATALSDDSAYKTRDQALSAFWDMGANERAEFDSLVAQFDGKAPSQSRSNQVWRTVVGYSQETYNADPNNPKSPMDIMRQQAQYSMAMRKQQATGGGAGGIGGTRRIVNLTNESDAQYLIDQTLQQYLGRVATDDERAEFYKTLNKAQRQNPIISTPTGTRGGVSEAQVAREFARSREEAAEQRAAGQYMDWFMEKLMQDPMEGLQSGL